MKMNAFVNSAVNLNKMGKTFNGADTYLSTESRVLDLFKAIGQRGVDLTKAFDLALSEDKNLALRLALWTRDIRGGAGERAHFRNFLRHMEKHYTDEALLMVPHIPTYGRWDDLQVFETPLLKKMVFLTIKGALEKKDGLCAKWLPRKGKFANELRLALEWSPKRYRKTIVELSKTVETQMCAREWDKIVYDHVPSVAAARYQKAFFKHDPEGYKAYRDGLVKVNPETGKTERKINASAIFPYEIIKSVNKGDRAVAEAQWNALPNYLGNQKILSIVDVSGSMGGVGYGPNVTPMEIALSLGIYTADKLTGDFNGMFMTFSSYPKLQKLTGGLVDKLNQLSTAHWDMSTNVERAFTEILRTAKAGNVPQEDMPDILLIISDMEFNNCARGTNYQNARILFEQAGYALPKVVFWNVNARVDNNQVQAHQSGTALVSGFSPAIFKAILSDKLEDFSPYNVMKETLLNSRYDIPGLTV